MPFIVTTKRLGKYGPQHYAHEADVFSRVAVATLEERQVFDSDEWRKAGYDQPEGNGRFWHNALILETHLERAGVGIRREELATVLFLHNGRQSTGRIVSIMRPAGSWLIPESGGTVGPLPDGTVIEVETTTWPVLVGAAYPDAPSDGQGYAARCAAGSRGRCGPRDRRLQREAGVVMADLDRVCVCGHQARHHFGGGPCIADTPSGEASTCACLKFAARDDDGHRP